MEFSNTADMPLQPRPAGCPVPLTYGQQAMWRRLAKEEKALSSRMCIGSLRLRGPLDVDLMQRSIEAVVQRHESLRTTIAQVNNIPRQLVSSPRNKQFEFVDLTKSGTNAVEEARSIGWAFAAEEIDLSVGPLFGSKLLRVSTHDHVLVLTLHHIVSDALSNFVLKQEISTLYRQFTEKGSYSLPQLRIQFPDYAVWQNRTYDTWFNKHGTYWKAHLAGVPSPQFPLDDGPTNTNQLAAAPFPLGKALSAKLNSLARQEGTLLSLVVLAIYAAAISRWCNQDDLLIRPASHGRHQHPELGNMIGLLAANLPLRIKVRKIDSLNELLKRIHQEFQCASSHQGFGHLVNFLPESTDCMYFNWIPRSASINLEVWKPDDRLRIAIFPMQPLHPEEALAVKTFSPVFSNTKSGIMTYIGYHPGAFAKNTIERFGNNFRLLAKELVENPRATVASIKLP